MSPLTHFLATHQSEADVATAIQGLDVPKNLHLLSDLESDDEIISEITTYITNGQQVAEAESPLIQGKMFI